LIVVAYIEFIWYNSYYKEGVNMKKLFTFINKKDSSTIITIASKVYKATYIILACLSAVSALVFGIMQSIDFGIGPLLIMILMGGASFFLILLIGIFIESLILGFGIIVKNNYEELVLKSKVEDSSELDEEYIQACKKLEHLNELKKNGVISEEEFNEIKEELLKKF